MKTVTIRELHSRTGQLVRSASRHGEIRVTDSGRVIAKIVPEAEPAARVPGSGVLRGYNSGRAG